MKRMILTVFASITLLSPPAMGETGNPDIINGFRTNDFNRFWPEGEESPDGYHRKATHSDPSAHMATAEYEAEDGSSFANIRIVGWPLEQPSAIADDDTEILEQSITGIRQNIEDEGWAEPDAFDLDATSGKSLSCLRTLQTEQAEFTYCVTSVKGRLMEIQHLASVEANPEDAREEVAKNFITALTDHLVEAN